MNEVIDNMKKIVGKETIVIGVSGGPDSMALLSLSLFLNTKVICAHVNHNVRKESYDEAIMVKDFCKKNNIIFHQMTIDKYSNENFHKTARDKRYDFYDGLIKKYNAKFLLTAHHGDDLMETILMRIVRGSSLNGYSGFSFLEKRDDYFIFRPLIKKTKNEILKYVLENNIPYAIDASNEKDVYTRNRFRKYILPPLKEENKNVHLKFYSLSEEIKEVNDFLEIETKKALNECFKNNKLNLKLFNGYHIALKKNILKTILSNLYKEDIILINNEHLKQILSLQKANSILYFPKNIKVIKSYDYITFECLNKKDEYKIEIKDEVFLPNGKMLKVLKSVNDNSNNVIKLSKNDVKFPLFVRSKKDGDRIILKGSGYNKKVKDILINEKVPLKEREDYPLVVDSNDVVVWVPGLKKSKFDISNLENCDIIIKYI